MDIECIIELAKSLLKEAEGLDLRGISAAKFAQEKLMHFPEFGNKYVHELIYKCAIDPSTVSGLANPRFGEPSIIVAESENWVFEVISWRYMVTAIHEHSYYGAFKSLEGKRLHFTFEFTDDLSFSDDRSLKLGLLNCIGMHEINAGEVNCILKEREFIHSVWPLSKNCSTVVLRQKGPSNSWSYLPNRITYDERLAERYLSKRLRYLEDLQLYSKELYDLAITKIVNRSPFSVVVYLIMALNITTKDKVFHEIYTIIEGRNKDFAEAMREMTEIDELFRDVYRLKRFSTSEDENRNLAIAFYSKILSKKNTLHLLGREFYEKPQPALLHGGEVF